VSALAAGAVAGRPFFLPFPLGLLPSLAAAAAGVAFSRRRLIPALDIAYVSASVGSLIGLDLVPLLASPLGTAGAITLGSGGILDLVFLSGVLAVAIAWFSVMTVRLLRRERKAPEREGDLERSLGPRAFLWQPRRKAAPAVPARVDIKPK